MAHISMTHVTCMNESCHTSQPYGVATISKLLKIMGLFCKRALLKRLFSAKQTYNFKEPTHLSPLRTRAHQVASCWVRGIQYGLFVGARRSNHFCHACNAGTCRRSSCVWREREWERECVGERERIKRERRNRE